MVNNKSLTSGTCHSVQINQLNSHVDPPQYQPTPTTTDQHADSVEPVPIVDELHSSESDGSSADPCECESVAVSDPEESQPLPQVETVKPNRKRASRDKDVVKHDSNGIVMDKDVVERPAKVKKVYVMTPARQAAFKRCQDAKKRKLDVMREQKQKIAQEAN